MARRIIMMSSPTELSTSGSEERSPFDSPYLPGRGLLQESLFLAAIVFIAGEIIAFALAYLAVPLGEAFLLTLSLAPVIAAVAAGVALVLAVYRVLRYERREKRYLEMMDLQVERLRREIGDGADYGVASESRPSRFGEPVDRRWNRIAYEMLRRYYTTLERTGSREAAGRAMSRDAMVQAGICTQKEWNIVNRLLVKRGIRDGRRRSLKPDTFDEAWNAWRRAQANVRGWYIEDGMWIPKE